MPEKPETGRRQSRGRSLPIDEVHRQYDGEWVLLHVTAFDERHWPSRGKILCHSPDRDAINRAVPPAGDPRVPLYIFLAEPRLRSGPEYIKAMEEFVARLNAQLEAARAGMA